MPRTAIFSIVLLVLGVVVFIWGLNASESLASETSEVFQGAPSNKAIVLMVVGGIIGAAGLIGLFRRGR